MDILFFINRIDGGMQGSAPQFELGFQPPVASYLIIYIYIYIYLSLSLYQKPKLLEFSPT